MNSVIKLIKTAKEKGLSGIPKIIETGFCEIYAEQLSVGYSEFYAAESAGIKNLCKFKIYKEEYSGEELAEFEGKRYNIIKQYDLKGDFIEITLANFEVRK